MTHPKIDFTGRVYGKLSVISFVERMGGVNIWSCRCRCGALKNIRSHNLTSGHTLSCGCYMAQRVSEAKTKHGHNKSNKLKTPEYNAWLGIHTRCSNPRARNYSQYGGRGIKVCDRWRDFTNFITDMGTRPSDNHSIDRIDNNGNYKPSNCKWSTNKEQARNRTSNVVISYKGEEKILVEWAEKLGMRMPTLWARLKSGWTVERAFEKPIKESAA